MFGKLFARFPALTPAIPQSLRHHRDIAPFLPAQPFSATEIRAALVVRHVGLV